MTTDVSVGLDARDFASNGSDGYTDATTSGNQTYSYKYTGGTDGHGNTSEPSSAGEVDITVTITGANFQIESISKTDPESQLTTSIAADKLSATIVDANTPTEDGYYSIVVKDTSTNQTFTADPRVTNRP